MVLVPGVCRPCAKLQAKCHLRELKPKVLRGWGYQEMAQRQENGTKSSEIGADNKIEAVCHDRGQETKRGRRLQFLARPRRFEFRNQLCLFRNGCLDRNGKDSGANKSELQGKESCD